jgi:hypothetical protein
LNLILVSEPPRRRYSAIQPMDLSEPSVNASRSLTNLHREMRLADPVDLSEYESPYLSPSDDQFVSHPLHMELYNPMPSSKEQRLQQDEPNVPVTREKKDAARSHHNRRHQKKSSTASLAEFLKTTGPEEARKANSVKVTRPVSPVESKKKSTSNFLLKLAVGKSTQPRKDESDAATIAKTSASSSIAIAQPKLTAAGRRYYAIKVDYPLADDASGRPLLDDSQNGPDEDTRSEMDYQAIMAMKKHHRISSVLASETSMEFLVDGTQSEITPRSSGRYSSYPPSRGRYSPYRSNSLSELASPSESIRDDGSIMPGDSISLRPAQVNRTRMSIASLAIRSPSSPLPSGMRQTSSVPALRSPSPSYVTTTLPDGESEVALDNASVPQSHLSNEAMELMESLEALDQYRRQKLSSDNDSVNSYATTRSIQHRRRIRRQDPTSPTECRVTKPPRPKKDLNAKGLPLLPPHVNNTADEAKKARAAAVAAALSPRVKKPSSDRQSPSSKTEPRSQSPIITRTQHQTYSIPEDDVLSLRSGVSAVSAYRDKRREKVRGRRQRDLDDERSRKLDEAMRLLQKDVLRKKEALEKSTGGSRVPTAPSSVGSQTPRQMPSVERLRTPPRTPPEVLPYAMSPVDFYQSPIVVLVDCSPSGHRKKIPALNPLDPSGIHRLSSNSVFTNGSIPSPPSSPTKLKYDALVKAPIPAPISSPPKYPPPKPSGTPLAIPARMSKDEREMRIAALEEQKWVLEQALRVLLNQQSVK